MEGKIKFSIGAWIIEAIAFGIILLCALALMSGCDEQLQVTPTAEVLSGSNLNLEAEQIEYNGRLGAEVDKTEAGLLAAWSDDVDKDWHALGVYIQQKLLSDPNIILIGDISLGVQATVDLSEGKQGMYAPYISKITKLGGIDIDTQFQYRHYVDALAALAGRGNDKWKVLIGPKFYLKGGDRP